MSNKDQDAPIFRISIGQEKYDRILMGRELAGKLSETLANLEADPVFQFVQPLVEKSGVKTQPKTLPFEIYEDTDGGWVSYEPTKLLDELSLRFSRKLNDQKPTLSLRFGRIYASLEEGVKPIQRSNQIMVGACFLASFAEVVELAALTKPTDQFNGLLSTIHASEGKDIPLSIGLRIHHNLSPELNSNGSMLLGVFSPNDKFYPIVMALRKRYPDEIFEADHKLLYFRTPFPLETLLAKINRDNKIMSTPMAVATAWQRFKF